MRTGWQIVIAGRDFDPADVLRTSQIQPRATWRREVESESGRHDERGIEFGHLEYGPYLADMMAEALGYLEDYREEFEKLCALPGVETRSLIFTDTTVLPGGDFELSPSAMALLASLEITVSISVRDIDCEEDSPTDRDW